MSFTAITVNIERPVITQDAGGGETRTYSTVYSGLSMTVHFPDKDSLTREETGSGASSGPGTLTRSDRVLFLDPWAGTQVIRVDDVVVPSPAVAWLPARLRVVGVRPYEDGAFGELQLDVEDVG